MLLVCSMEPGHSRYGRTTTTTTNNSAENTSVLINDQWPATVTFTVEKLQLLRKLEDRFYKPTQIKHLFVSSEHNNQAQQRFDSLGFSWIEICPSLWYFGV